jgi:hypothetical protein
MTVDNPFYVPERGTKEYDKWVKDQQVRLAKQTAAFAKANPTASPGLALNAGRAGMLSTGNLAAQASTLDVQSQIDAQRSAALTTAAKFKESNTKGDGSPVDWLAPVTRTAFMALSTPFELLEATVRNVAGGKSPFDNVLGQTSTGQAIMQLAKTGRIDVGTGFLDVDPNSAVGKALLKSKIKAGPKMSGGQPWTYQSGLTNALFDDPETKAARTFQAVSGFVFNLAFDPLTYVPGVGLLKVGKSGVSLRLGKAYEAKKAARQIIDETKDDVAALKARRPVVAAEDVANPDKTETLARLRDDVDTSIDDAIKVRDELYAAKNSQDLSKAEFGEVAQRRDAARAALAANENRLEVLRSERAVKEAAESGTLMEGAEEATLSFRTLAEFDNAISETENTVASLRQAVQESDAAYASGVKETQDLVASRDAAKAALEADTPLERLALEADAGLLRIDDTSVLNYQKFSDFLFGKHGRNVANMVARHYGPDDYFKVWQAFGGPNGNITIDVARTLAAATSEKEVLGVLAAEAGLDVSGAAKRGLAARAIKFQPGQLVPEGAKMQFSMTQQFWNKLEGTKAGAKLTDNMFTRFAPTRGLISLDDADTLVREMYNTIPFLRGSEALRDRAVQRMMAADNPAARFEVFMDTLTDLAAEQMPNLRPEQMDLLKEASRVFRKEKDLHRNFLAQVSAEGGNVEYLLANGKKIQFSQFDPLIDSQLTAFVKWPDVDQMRQLTGAMRDIFSRGELVQDVRRVATDLFDARFKQLVLVGRVSYIARNIMDMQVRSYLAGSSTLFNHPLRMIALMVGNPEGNGIQKQLSKMARFQNDVFGKNFDRMLTSDENAKFTSTALADADRYAALMARSLGFGVGSAAAGYRQLPTGMRFIGSTDKKFNRAWASGILQYRASDAARLVAGGLDSGAVQDGVKLWHFQEAPAFIEAKRLQGLDYQNPDDYLKIITDFMFETKRGRDLRKLIADVDEETRAVMMDANETVAREAVEAYFKTIQMGIDNLSAGSKEIRDYIAGKQMVDVNGNVQVHRMDSNIPRDRWLAKILAGHRASVDVENTVGQLRLPSEFTAGGRGLVARWDTAVSAFFRLSSTIEKRASLGPEFRQQYWNGVAENAPLLSRQAGEEILKVAEKELRGVRVFGLPASATNPALAKLRAAVKDLPAEGGINRVDMNDIASAYASRQLEKLFYDATRQKQYAAAARLVAPFVSAWANTLSVWGGLITKDVTNTFKLAGQARAYKAANAFEFLNHPETGAIYEWLGEGWHDPSQGFIFNDPTYGDKRIVMPFAGDLLGAMLSPVAGVDVPGMPVSLSVPSLNLAFSNELLPGVGPAIQLTVGRAIQNQNGWIADQLRDIIYPFGAPEKGTGLIETFTPAWAQRILYGLQFDSYEKKNISTLRPIMAYLATTGKYGDLPISAEQQNKLIEDSFRVNRVLALWRGIMQNVSPGSIAPMILAKDKSGELHVQALMVNDFAQIRANNPDNYATAISKWADKYGENALFALVSGTRGGITPTDKAWQFYTENRDDANQFPNAFALFFPGGVYSAEFAKWQEQRGQRFKLTPADMQAEAASYVYSARKAKLQQDEATAVAMGADPRDAHDVYLARKDALDAEFGGEPETRSIGVPRETLVKEVTQALGNEKFAATNAGKGLAAFLDARSQALAAINQLGFENLNGKTVAPIADWLNSKAYEIISQYEDFSVMYWRVFAAETGNR